MKIAALSPQFVVEAPPGEEVEDARRSSEEMSHLRLVEAPPEGGETEDSLKDETRAGLKRLAELIRKNSRQQADKERAQDQSKKRANSKDLAQAAAAVRREQAVHKYLQVACYTDPRDIHGIALDKFY